MPVIPEFSPAAPSGQGFRQSQNLMMQAAQNRRQQELADMQRIEFEIKRPVMESQARVQLASEANDLTATHIVNNSIAGDLQRFPQYVQEWTRTATIEDPKERLGERRRILGAITPFASIKSTAPMVKAFQEQFAQDALEDKTADHLMNRLEVVGAQNEGKLAAKEKDLAIREATIKAQMERFQMQQEHARQMQEAQAKARSELETQKGEIQKTRDAAKATTAGMQRMEPLAFKENQAVLKIADAAETELRGYNIALNILSDPAIRTGTGAEFASAVNRLGGVLGADVTKAANMEQLNNVLSEQFYARAQALKGSFSDKEGSNLQKQIATVGKTNEGNIAILKNFAAAAERARQARPIIAEMRKEGVPEYQILNAWETFKEENPLQSFQVEPLAGKPSGLTPEEQTRLQELRAKLGK